MCPKFTGNHPCRSAISIKFQRNFIEITRRHGCFPVNLLHIFRTTFPENTSGGLLLTSLRSITFYISILFYAKKFYIFSISGYSEFKCDIKSALNSK